MAIATPGARMIAPARRFRQRPVHSVSLQLPSGATAVAGTARGLSSDGLRATPLQCDFVSAARTTP
jgi:hypothetical protein